MKDWENNLVHCFHHELDYIKEITMKWDSSKDQYVEV